jgi:hypothetical protein
VLAEPMVLPPSPTETDTMILSIEYSRYVKQKRLVQQGVEALFSLLWDQCTDAMRQQLEALRGHSDTAEDLHGIKLLKEVKSLAYNYQSQKFVGSSFVEAYKALVNCMQDKLKVQEYQEKFQNTADVFEAKARMDALTNHLDMHQYPPTRSTLARHMVVSVMLNRPNSALRFATNFLQN